MLDGDEVRRGLSRDLGFSNADRAENIRRIAEVARHMTQAGLIVSVRSPFRAERQIARDLMDEGEFIEVFVDTRSKNAFGTTPRDSTRRLWSVTSATSPATIPPMRDPHMRKFT